LYDLTTNTLSSRYVPTDNNNNMYMIKNWQNRCPFWDTSMFLSETTGYNVCVKLKMYWHWSKENTRRPETGNLNKQRSLVVHHALTNIHLAHLKVFQYYINIDILTNINIVPSSDIVW